ARRCVVVAHPGRQHVFETVLAAQESDLLQGFATGVFLSGDRARRISRLASGLPGIGRIARTAPDRSHPVIDPERVTAFPARHLAARLTRRLPLGRELERWADRGCDAAIGRWTARLDPPPAIVHAFEGGALATFRAAHRIGAATVLDVP